MHGPVEASKTNPLFHSVGFTWITFSRGLVVLILPWKKNIELYRRFSPEKKGEKKKANSFNFSTTHNRNYLVRGGSKKVAIIDLQYSLCNFFTSK